jgi:hypothetical protein
VDRPLGAVERAGDVLLHVDHPNISFGEGVVTQHMYIMHEEQYRVLMCARSIQQIAGGMLYGLPALAVRGWCARMHLISFFPQRHEAGA